MNQLTNYLADQLQKFYRSCMNTAQDSSEISSTQSQVPVTFTQSLSDVHSVGLFSA